MKPLSHLRLIQSGLVSVSTISSRYGISKATLYEIIKSDPSVPYLNVGLKKKIMIDAEEFETWINNRTEKQKDAHFDLPTADKLLQKYRR